MDQSYELIIKNGIKFYTIKPYTIKLAILENNDSLEQKSLKFKDSLKNLKDNSALYLMIKQDCGIYIGQSENFYRRFFGAAGHIEIAKTGKGNSFFKEANILAFIYSDDLDNTHIRLSLESWLISKFTSDPKYEKYVINKAMPKDKKRSEFDEINIKEYRHVVKKYLALLFNNLEWKEEKIDTKISKEINDVFKYKTGRLKVKVEDGKLMFYLLKGSEVKNEAGMSFQFLSNGVKQQYYELKKSGKFIEENGKLVVSEDIKHSTPSRLESFVSGTAGNGWYSWNKDGKSLKDVFGRESKSKK